MTPLTGTIKYEAQGKEYESDLFVDLEHYMTFFSATTDEEDLLKSMNKISDQLKGIRTLQRLAAGMGMKLRLEFLPDAASAALKR